MDDSRRAARRAARLGTFFCLSLIPAAAVGLDLVSCAIEARVQPRLLIVVPPCPPRYIVVGQSTIGDTSEDIVTETSSTDENAGYRAEPVAPVAPPAPVAPAVPATPPDYVAPVVAPPAPVSETIETVETVVEPVGTANYNPNIQAPAPLAPAPEAVVEEPQPPAPIEESSVTYEDTVAAGGGDQGAAGLCRSRLAIFLAYTKKCNQRQKNAQL